MSSIRLIFTLLCCLRFVQPAPDNVSPEEVTVLVGDPVVINCTTADESYDANDLVFTLLPDKQRLRETVRRIDARTKQLLVDNADSTYDNVHVHCYRRTESESKVWLGTAVIHVGEEPGPIRDFRCVSPNWERMLCTWNCSRVAGHGGIGGHFVNYELKYTLDANTPSGSEAWKICPKFVRSSVADERCQCSFEEYYLDFLRNENYTFDVRTWSEFGERTENFHAIPITIVRPDPVSGLNVVDKSPTWLTITWSNPPRLDHSIIKLIYQIRYHSDYGTQAFNRSDCEKHCTANLTGLIPYTNYTVSVRSTTQQFSTYWSAWQVITERTLPSVAARSPETSPGSFLADIADDTALDGRLPPRDIDLYFKDVPPEYIHGALVDMRVTVWDGNQSAVYNCQNTMRLRYCKLVQLDCAKEYQVTLEPKTTEGYNPSGPTSIFRLAPCDQGPAPVEHFVGELYEGTLEESIIRFTWKPPQERTNLTLYYCSSTNCQGGLKWRDIPSGVSSFNLTVDHQKRSINDYKFSIASHNQRGSRGMTSWSTCLYDWDGEPGQPVLKPGADELKRPDSLTVDIVAPECQKGSGRILQYKLHYASVSDSDEGTPLSNTTVVLGPYTGSYRIEDLYYHTHYIISVTALGRAGEKQSPAITMTTLAPPPLSSEVWGVIIFACVIIVLLFICLLYRLYRHLRETPIEIKLPIDDTDRASGDVAEVEEELLHDLMHETSLQFPDSDCDIRDETERKLLPAGSLTEVRSAKQRSRDSGNCSLLSDAPHDPPLNGAPSLAVVEEDVRPQFIQGPDDYVLQVHIPTAYENKNYNSVPVDSSLSSEPVSPGSESLASNEASSQDSDIKVKKPHRGSESDSYWQVGMKHPDNNEQILDDNGNTAPVNSSKDDNGYGSTTPNDASLTNCEDSDSGSQYSLDSGHSMERTPCFGPIVMNGDYVIRPDSLEPRKPVNSCGESSEDTDNSETGQDYAKVGLSPEAMDSRVLGLGETSEAPLVEGKKHKPVTLEPNVALV